MQVSNEVPRFPGQPPLHINAARSCTDKFTASLRAGAPSRICARDNCPLLCRSSNSDMGRMRSRKKRPAPVWRVASSSGTADPVSMKWPLPGSASTARRTWFQITGADCHSSISRGLAPARTRPGSTAIMPWAVESTSSMTWLAASLRAVSVLPQARGPSMSTAPAAFRHRSSSPSATRCRYGSGGGSDRIL